MECRLASSEDPWCCQISIRYEFEPNGGRRLKDVIERKFGDLIIKKSQVEPMLRKAQWSVLNPKLSYEHILGMSMHEMDHNSSDCALRFSRNVVCVDLKGPGLTDLSFIDLPGMVSTDLYLSLRSSLLTMQVSFKMLRPKPSNSLRTWLSHTLRVIV